MQCVCVCVCMCVAVQGFRASGVDFCRLFPCLTMSLHRQEEREISNGHFRAKTDNVKNILQILKTMNFRDVSNESPRVLLAKTSVMLLIDSEVPILTLLVCVCVCENCSPYYQSVIGGLTT